MSAPQESLFPEFDDQSQLGDQAPDWDKIRAEAASGGRAASRNITEYETAVSDAAWDDQRHGPQELGTPIEDKDHPRRRPEAIAAQEAANQKRRQRAQRVRETRFTDIGSDTPQETPEQGGERISLSQLSPDIAVLFNRILGATAARGILAKSGNDVTLSSALLQKQQDQPKFPHKQ